MSRLPLILASGSPRRQAFLHALGLDFSVRAADIDETPLPNELPAALAWRLATAKAIAVGALLGVPVLIIAADTVVAKTGLWASHWMPPRRAPCSLHCVDAIIHVVTAISLLESESGIQRTLVNDTTVSMRLYTNDEIDGYIVNR